MNTSIQFDKFTCEETTIYNCKDGGWQLSKEHGLHKCSPARDYLVKWVQHHGKWSLYITNYNSSHFTCIVTTLDTLFDVFDYISENRYAHYTI
jgi:hypothetical protein